MRRTRSSAMVEMVWPSLDGRPAKSQIPLGFLFLPAYLADGPLNAGISEKCRMLSLAIRVAASAVPMGGAFRFANGKAIDDVQSPIDLCHLRWLKSSGLRG